MQTKKQKETDINPHYLSSHTDTSSVPRPLSRLTSTVSHSLLQAILCLVCLYMVHLVSLWPSSVEPLASANKACWSRSSYSVNGGTVRLFLCNLRVALLLPFICLLSLTTSSNSSGFFIFRSSSAPSLFILFFSAWWPATKDNEITHASIAWLASTVDSRLPRAGCSYVSWPYNLSHPIQDIYRPSATTDCSG